MPGYDQLVPPGRLALNASIGIQARITVPEGLPIIARHFNAGIKLGFAQVPQERLNLKCAFPFPLFHSVELLP